jgi:UDP-N-acetylmuramoyl-tripeptide--D-alanyl-D-alanine ligase
MQLTLGEIAKVLEIPAVIAPEQRVEGYSIDSRTLQPGELFFAVRGERLDGHDYVLQALAQGASGAVVEATRREKFPAWAQPKLLPVASTLGALQKLAGEVRRRWAGPVVAVTGSAGKTTTKQIIAVLLGTRCRVLESERNLNNHFGLPLSLLRLKPEHEAGVFELGMSSPGEIRWLAKFAAPDLGVVTNVSAVHLEFFRDVEAIARAKFELIETLGPEAWAVLNVDDSRVRAFGDQIPGRVLSFGISQPAHFRARDLAVRTDGSSDFTLPAESYASVPPGVIRGAKVHGKETRSVAPRDVRFHLPLLGRHNVLNALAALAACYAFGIPPASLPEAVAALRPGSMRGEMVRLANGVLLVNDCYNSNPEALETMLTSVASLPAKRRIAVLGGMMELGPASQALHLQCGRRVAELGFDGLVALGEEARGFAQGAREAGMAASAVSHVDSPGQAASRLQELLQEGDVVLLKGSRAVRLEKVWEALLSNCVSEGRL